MDVGELLSFKPQKPELTSKRKEEEEDEEEPATKKRKGGQGGGQTDGANDQDKILQMMDDVPETEPLDDTSLKKMLLQFEKRVYKNQEMRIKFPDMPEKFMESELELNDILQHMHVIATVPELYHVLVELNTVRSLLQLLSHENTGRLPWSE